MTIREVMHEGFNAGTLSIYGHTKTNPYKKGTEDGNIYPQFDLFFEIWEAAFELGVKITEQQKAGR